MTEQQSSYDTIMKAIDELFELEDKLVAELRDCEQQKDHLMVLLEDAINLSKSLLDEPVEDVDAQGRIGENPATLGAIERVEEWYKNFTKGD